VQAVSAKERAALGFHDNVIFSPHFLFFGFNKR
jgi:hypothetical protein